MPVFWEKVIDEILTFSSTLFVHRSTEVKVTSATTGATQALEDQKSRGDKSDSKSAAGGGGAGDNDDEDNEDEEEEEEEEDEEDDDSESVRRKWTGITWDLWFPFSFLFIVSQNNQMVS